MIMAKFIVCEVVPSTGGRISMDDKRTVALNVDIIDGLHQDIFQVENGDGSIRERIGLEVLSSRLKDETDGRLVILSDYDSFIKKISNEDA